MIDAKKIDRPGGASFGNWFRYAIGRGSSPITGNRRGTLDSVRGHADEFAENLNRRSIQGNFNYAGRNISIG